MPVFEQSPAAPVPSSPLPESLSSPLRTLSAAPSRGDEITDRLITAIAVGEYLPGARLPSERNLAASLRVGRMAVRAALSQLVADGLLETQRGRSGGSFVSRQWQASSDAAVRRTLTAKWESIREMCEALGLLHGVVARAAAGNRTDSDAATLHERLEAFRVADSGHQSQQADARLHAAISTATHNSTLNGMLADLEARLSIASPAHPWGPVEGMREMEVRALKDHEDLVGAICAGNAAAAEETARRHVRIDLEMMEAALRKLVKPGE